MSDTICQSPFKTTIIEQCSLLECMSNRVIECLIVCVFDMYKKTGCIKCCFESLHELLTYLSTCT